MVFEKFVIDNMRKRIIPSILKWVCSNFIENPNKSLKAAFWPSESFYLAQNYRLYSTRTTVESANFGTSLSVGSENVSKISDVVRKEAQAALLEYLHLTRNLPFIDSEHMSKNSPRFVEKLVERFENKLDIEQLVARFLRYHPINEFEPFFESLGLKPREYSPLLNRNLIFLSDDELLLENYHVLCNYGVARNKMGKILKEAMEVFRYDVGVLQSKLQAYEELGLTQSLLGKVIVCSPYLLMGDVNVEFVVILEILKRMGIESCWIEGHLLEQDSCNWSMMLSCLRLFSKIGYSDGQLGRLIKQHPGLLFEGSGNIAFTLIGLLLKFGCTRNDIYSVFLHFPQIEVGKFLLNLNRCLLFLFEIKMKGDEIGKIFRSHFMLLGSCWLKKTNSILASLNVGKRRLCKYIQENPLELKNLVLGSRVRRLPSEKETSQMLKTKFLINVGYVENSKEMEKARQVFMGRGAELQERFDCIVNAGLDRKDVFEMIRISPRILNKTKDVIETKIDFLVNYLGYPVSCLMSFPSYFNYSEERIKLRCIIGLKTRESLNLSRPLVL